jgi:hypothetical protein
VGSNPAGGHGCLSLVSVVCCQAEVSATGRSLVQRIPTDRGVSAYGREATVIRRHWPARSCCVTGGGGCSISLDYTENKTNGENRGKYVKKKREKCLHFKAHTYPLKTNEYFAVRYFFFFLLRWRYSPLWALACRTIPLHVSGCRLPLRTGNQKRTYVKPEAAITVFELLMMGGVSHETC